MEPIIYKKGGLSFTPRTFVDVYFVNGFCRSQLADKIGDKKPHFFQKYSQQN